MGVQPLWTNDHPPIVYNENGQRECNRYGMAVAVPAFISGMSCASVSAMDERFSSYRLFGNGLREVWAVWANGCPHRLF